MLVAIRGKVADLKKEEKSLSEILAAKPTAPFDSVGAASSGLISSPSWSTTGFNSSRTEIEVPSRLHMTHSKSHLRDYLAAERTFLAWIRTGLALMGFGFVIARFGIEGTRSHPSSLWLGLGLMALGMVVNVVAGVHEAHVINCLDRGAEPTHRSVAYGIMLALLLAVMGAVLAVYLVRGRHPLPISRLITRNPVCCRAEQKVDACEALMRNHKVRKLPVVDENWRCGIVSWSIWSV